MRRSATYVALAFVLLLATATTLVSTISVASSYGTFGLTTDWRTTPSGRELVVASVERGSPADRAGLRAGDRITGFPSLADRIAITIQTQGAPAVGQQALLSIERGSALVPVTLRAAAVTPPRATWFWELRLAIYFAGALAVCALVAMRPTRVTWSFALFVTFELLPSHWIFVAAGMLGSPPLYLVVWSSLACMQYVGLLGLVAFAARFPEQMPHPGYRAVEICARVFMSALLALWLAYFAGSIFGTPAVDIVPLGYAWSFVPAFLAIVLLTGTLLRSRGESRVPLAWAVAGPAIATLLDVANTSLTSVAPLIYTGTMGLLASLAPFCTMYAIVRYRVIDIGLSLSRSFAQAVSQAPAPGGEPREAKRLLVRRVAQLLSAEVPLPELYGDFAALLAQFVHADSVLVAARTPRGVRLEYAYEDGAGARPDNVTIGSASITGQVIDDGEARLLQNAQDWPEASKVVSIAGRATGDVESALFVPIEFAGSVIGVLSVQSRRANAYDEEDLALLEACAVYLGARLNDALQTIARGGPQMSLDEAVVRAWQRCERTQAQFAVLLVDVDLFRSFADIYGRDAADACLRHLAGAVASSLREQEHELARGDGVTLSAILYGADETTARRYGEWIGATVRALRIPHQGSSLGFVSVSAGTASCVARKGGDPQEAVARARDDLDRAKREKPALPKVVVRHNLPESHTAFVGRSADIEEIEAALGTHRLVTVAGTGGVGKTRIALEVARRALERYPGGVWLADLTTANNAEALAHIVAASMGPSARGGDALLVLDNCEHLVEASARAASAMLDENAGMRLLATSREPLLVRGESVYRLPTLATADAVRLFLDRTQGAPSPGDRASIESIVTRLDGLPMAIELAAARSTMHAPSELLVDLPERHQSLRALFDWSYRLLTEEERIVLRRLSVFSGAWRLNDAATVCADDEIAPADVVGALESLVAKSLVVREGREGATRFRLLETTRQYAAAALESSGEGAAVALRHVRLAAARARELERAKTDLAFSTWLAMQEAEFANYRAALRTALQCGDDDTVVAIFDSLGDLADDVRLAEIRRRPRRAPTACGTRPATRSGTSAGLRRTRTVGTAERSSRSRSSRDGAFPRSTRRPR